MRRLAASMMVILAVGCTPRDDESAKTIAALKSELETARKKLVTAEAANKKLQEAQKDRLRDPDIRTADWALANGGELVLRVGDRPLDVHAAGELPTEHFQVLQVRLKSNRRIDDAGLAALQGLSHIRSLDLFDTKIGDAAVVHIASLSSLEGLSLRDTQVTDAGAWQLRRLTNLKLLDLAGTSVTPTTVDSLKRALPRCQIDSGEKR